MNTHLPPNVELELLDDGGVRYVFPQREQPAVVLLGRVLFSIGSLAIAAPLVWLAWQLAELLQNGRIEPLVFVLECVVTLVPALFARALYWWSRHMPAPWPSRD